MKTLKAKGVLLILLNFIRSFLFFKSNNDFAKTKKKDTPVHNAYCTFVLTISFRVLQKKKAKKGKCFCLLTHTRLVFIGQFSRIFFHYQEMLNGGKSKSNMELHGRMQKFLDRQKVLDNSKIIAIYQRYKFLFLLNNQWLVVNKFIFE